jgi:alpha-beta hydrolase superfamily lysophospholipase
MRRRLLVVVALACLCGGGTAATAKSAWTKHDYTVTASDGVKMATTLYEPDGTPPTGGWPAIVMFHGLGGTRASMNTIAEATFANEGYAVLTADHRGHGESGGLFNTGGPREIQDARDLFDWLAARPEIDKSHIGAWGISLGGGVVWNSLKTGVPFAAAEVVETWVDLYQSLAPNYLAKSGAVFQFLNSVPADRTDPELNAIKADALNSTNPQALQAYAAVRSVRDNLSRIKTPVYVFQGRRDFAFGLEQGIEAYNGLGGPKRLYIGDFGHSPSTFPGPDAAVVFSEGTKWFAHYLQGDSSNGTAAKGVELAPDPFVEDKNVLYSTLPKRMTIKTRTAKPNKTIGSTGKVVTTYTLPARKLETFGPPTVVVNASTRTQAKQLVAVLEAVKGSTSTIVSEGGTLLPTARKAYAVSFPLIWDTALIAKGSKLRLTLSWTSTAQNAANLLYLTGVPDGSSLTVKSAYVTLPVLKSPISG